MKNGLTPEERSSIVDVDRFLHFHGRGMSDQHYAMAVKKSHAGDYVHGGYSDADKKRIAIGITDFLDLYAKRPANPNAYGAQVIECAQDAYLPAIEVLKILEEQLKKSRAVCSVAEFNELFLARKKRLKHAAAEASRVRKAHNILHQKMLECLHENAERYRNFIPDYPNVEALVGAWQPVLDDRIADFWGDLTSCQKITDACCRGMQAGDAWPAIAFYCVYLAAQIPSNKQSAAALYVYELCEGNQTVGDVPAHWHAAIAETSGLPVHPHPGEEVDGFPHPSEFFWDAFKLKQRDQTNAMWQVKLDATPPIHGSGSREQ